MTKIQFNRLRAAAHELVRLGALGAEVDADMLAWATEIVTLNPTPPFRPSVNHDKIFSALDDAPIEGMTGNQIGAETGLSKAIIMSTLCYMRKRDLIAAIKLPRMCVYFRNEAALELGLPLVMAAEDARQQTMQKTVVPKAPKPAPEKKISTAQKAFVGRVPEGQPLPVKAALPRPTKKAEASIFIPEGLMVQVIPHGRDTRLDVDPNSFGAGFASEWRQLRKGGSDE